MVRIGIQDLSQPEREPTSTWCNSRSMTVSTLVVIFSAPKGRVALWGDCVLDGYHLYEVQHESSR